VRSWIDRAGDAVVRDPSPSLVAQLVEAGQPFWLDIEDPTDEVIDQLATLLGLHPLAVEDSKQFGQRAKLQVYGNGAMLVGFGLDEQLREPVEVHCYYTTGFLITLRRAATPALDALRQTGSVRPGAGSDPIRALHRSSARCTPRSPGLSSGWTNGWIRSSSGCCAKPMTRNWPRSPR
jgi:magnesium transporter